MAASYKAQMVLSHDNSIIISKGRQPAVKSARQPSVWFLHPALYDTVVS